MKKKQYDSETSRDSEKSLSVEELAIAYFHAHRFRARRILTLYKVVPIDDDLLG